MKDSIHCVGIDFGNQNAIVAANTNENIKVCLNPSSTRLSPTLVSYGDERRFFGDLAQQNQLENINSTITCLKKLIGLKYQSAERERIASHVQFSMVELKNGYTGILIENVTNQYIFTPEQCIASLLKYLINISKENDPEVNKLYLSVDTFCSNIQRIGLLNAAKIAGIDCELVTSTVAAGATYIYSHKDKLPEDPQQSQAICVVDIGDSSLKASVLKLSQNSIEVIVNMQNDDISGNKITELLIENLLKFISQKYSINPSDKPSSMLQFLKSVEKAKKTLSVNTSVPFEYQYGDKYINFVLQRTDFEALIEESAEICASSVIELIKISDVQPIFIELIGGTSRIPLFRKKISEIGIPIVSDINVDECVAIGCAMKPSLQIADKLSYPIEISEGNITVFDALEFIPTKPKTCNIQNAKFSCDVKVESNDSDYQVFVDSNGVFRAVGDVKVTIPNDFSQNQIEKFKFIEKNLEKRDKDVIESYEFKNMLESKIFEAERYLRDMKKELLKEEAFQKLDQRAKENREWFDSNENIRHSKEEYKYRIEKLSSSISKAKRSIDLKDEVKQHLEKLNSFISKLKQEISQDQPRKDNGLKKRLLEMLDENNNILTTAQFQFQFPDLLNVVDKVCEFLKDNIIQICKKKEELLKMPLLVSKRRNPRENFWDEALGLY
ncbi:dnaK protein [Trichomonas vaginalis G3]|uniref:DnaK protein n=1 Tax=Trichomonas vaginalis (strain ATCC PRA-98 / G3) TaxID=412133 RepID=A2E5D4_TRIV3|nr:ATP binding [Trichomonas vaginalis G3]EAY12095.1 dnaK protein [Trichomonas vaginalis G3]KAI5542451.1 ATP binding [Trichomonas vaginalis G3]|eukprot:XP_001324318.1 dnaK protein [Trichomonas vaginalis G3]